MDENFDDSGLLDGERLRALSRRSDGQAVQRLVVHATLFVASGVFLLTSAGNWPLSVLAIMLYGTLTATLFGPLHECIHYNAFSTRRACDLVAQWCGFFMVLPRTWYRTFHFEHHRRTGDPARDPELLTGSAVHWPDTLALHVTSWVWGAATAGSLLLMIALLVLWPSEPVWRRMGFVPADKRARVVSEARRFAAGYAVIGALLWAVHPAALWSLLASLVVYRVVLTLHTACEHTDCPAEGPMVERTRTMISNPVWRYLMWNENYHAEHHTFPGVPFHALPELHGLMRRRLVHMAPGYVRVHRDALQRTRTGRAER